jgi:hypothetical protein
VLGWRRRKAVVAVTRGTVRWRQRIGLLKILGIVWCVEGVRRGGMKIFHSSGGPPYIHRLTDKCTAMYIHRLTDEYRGLYSLVPSTFLGFGTEEYSSVIFFDTEEYKNSRKVPYFPVVHLALTAMCEQCLLDVAGMAIALYPIRDQDKPEWRQHLEAICDITQELFHAGWV